VVEARQADGGALPVLTLTLNLTLTRTLILTAIQTLALTLAQTLACIAASQLCWFRVCACSRGPWPDRMLQRVGRVAGTAVP